MDANVTEFFSLEDSPAKPKQDTVLRDHYGFVVPPDYQELYRYYSPEWEREETEREEAWGSHLAELAHLSSDNGNFSDLKDLCNSYFHDQVTAARSGRMDASPERQQLDALVQGGVPFSIRGHVWAVFLDTSLRKQRGYYNDLVRRCLGELQHRGRLELDEIRQQAATAAAALQGASLHGLSAYTAVTEAALATWRANSRVWLTQIEKDLPRTFPGLALMELSGRPALRRVLAAYSLHNSRVGYCQGLNFVVGTLLLFLDEEEAFWCCCALLDDVLRGYYDVDMMAMQVDQRVFKELAGEHFPRLTAHLEALGADVSSVFVQWFLCVFVNYLPLEACLRVWDALFYHRSPTVLFKTALALLSVFSPALEAAGDVLEALDLLHSLAPLSYDSGRLLAAALGPELADVTDERLDALRAKHRREVEAEAAALAEELAWEASSSSGAATSASAASQPSRPADPQSQQPQGKISVLKMLARGVKEKFTGGGGSGAYGGGGSGTDSVERAASPAPDTLPLGAAPGGGGGSGGSAAAAVPAVAALLASGSAAGGSVSASVGGGSAVGAGGGTDEPLLVRSSHPLGGVDADSEDYHRLTGDDTFQYEQVGYVAPLEISETVNSAAVVLVGRPGEEDRSVGGAAAPAAAAVAPGLTEPQASDDSAAAPPPHRLTAASGGMVEPRLVVTASTRVAAAAADPLAALYDGGATATAERPVGPCYTWHETPKWQSIRAGSAASAGSFGLGVAPAAAAAAGSAPQLAATGATAGVVAGPTGSGSPLGALSPRAVILTAGRSQSESLMGVLPLGGATADDSVAMLEDQAGGDGSGISPLTHPLRAVGPAPEPSAAATAAAAPTALPAASAAGLPSTGALTATQAPTENGALAATLAAAASPSPAAAAASHALAPSSAGESGRRGPGGRRHCSRAASMAWEIALAPLKQRAAHPRSPPPPPPPLVVPPPPAAPAAAHGVAQARAQGPAPPPQLVQGQGRAGGPEHPGPGEAQGPLAAGALPPPQPAREAPPLHGTAPTLGPGSGLAAAPSGQGSYTEGPQGQAPAQQRERGSSGSVPAAEAPAPGLARTGQLGSASLDEALCTSLPSVGSGGSSGGGAVAGSGTCGSGLGGPLAAGAGAGAGAASPAARPDQAPGQGAAPADYTAGPSRLAHPATPAAAIPVAAPRAPHAHQHAYQPYPHPQHPAYYPHPYANGGGGSGGVTSPGGGGAGPQHPPPGSSVASTSSMLMVDEHREASPAEARDEWVIMSVPGGEGAVGLACRPHAASAGSGHHPGPRQILHSQIALFPPPSADAARPGHGAGHAPPVGYRGFEPPQPAPPPTQAGAAVALPGRDRAPSVSSGGDAAAAGAGSAAPVGAADGGTGGPWGLPPRARQSVEWGAAGSDGAPAFQALREQLGIEDLLLHHGALASRLRALRAQRSAGGAAAEADAADADVGPAAAAAVDEAAAGRTAGGVVDTPPRPLAPSGASAAEADPTGLTAALERLKQLEAAHAALLAAAQAAGNPDRDEADGRLDGDDRAAAASGVSGADTSGQTSRAQQPQQPQQPQQARESPDPQAVAPPPPLPSLPPLSTLPAAALFPEVLVAPGGQVVCAPLPSQPPSPAAPLSPAPSAAAAAPQPPLQQPDPAPPPPKPPATAPRQAPLHQQQQLAAPKPAVGAGPGSGDAVAAAAAVCASLRGDLERSRRSCGEGMELLQQYAVLAEVLTSRLDEVVRQLAEQQYTSRKLSGKLADVMQLYAAQDAALADREHASYQQHQQHPQPQQPQQPRLPGAGGSGAIGGLSSALGFGGGGGGGGVFPLPGGAFHGAAMRAAGALVAHVGAGGSGGGGGGGGAVAGPVGAQTRYGSPQRGLWQKITAKISGGRDEREYPGTRG